MKESMKNIKSYIVSMLVFSIIIVLSLSVSGCNKTLQSSNNTTTIVVSETLIPVEFIPLQCETTPWDAWLSNSDIRFIKAPTEQEVLSMFYANVYNITLTNITIINVSELTCEACGICNKGYKINVLVQPEYLNVMIDTGWEVPIMNGS